MNNNCIFKGEHCLCNVCKEMRELLEQNEKMNVSKLFAEPELQEMFEKMLKVKKCDYGITENKND